MQRGNETKAPFENIVKHIHTYNIHTIVVVAVAVQCIYVVYLRFVVKGATAYGKCGDAMNFRLLKQSLAKKIEIKSLKIIF